MGLFQRAIETYDAMEESGNVGVYVNDKEPLAPIGHICTKANIEITVSSEGNLIRACQVDQKIIIPVTEESAGRTSAIVAHPLCDQIGYVTNINQEKNSLYTAQLKKWAEYDPSRPKLQAVYKYVMKGTAIKDLEKAGLIKYDDKQQIKNDKDMICWRVDGLEKDSGPVWSDKGLMDSFISFYKSIKDGAQQEICMVSGQKSTEAKQHLKGTVSIYGNAKIISTNDTSNFTYRGRFTKESEAATVGYESSQKAHNALKWLSSNQGVREGGRTFICWNPHGKSIPKINLPIINIKNEPHERYLPSDYKKKLRQILDGYRAELGNTENVVIASFDAATSGRLAVTYFNEIAGSDFMERIQYWDETCCWHDSIWGTESPSLYNIVRFAFGTQRGSDDSSKVEVDEKVVSQHMQRLIHCRIDRAAFPRDVMLSLCEKVGSLLSYNAANRHSILFTACAVIRKYHFDNLKEEWEMALEPEKKDRSYQYGRLLAVMEKVERDTYDSGDERRETNAIRMQSVFVNRPAYATRIIMEQLKNGYYPKLRPGSRVYYEALIGNIIQMISETEEDQYNKPLGETYLLGYYLQKNELYSKKENKESEEETENE